MTEVLRFIPTIIMTIALFIISFAVEKKKRMPWLISAFIAWLLTFLYAIGVFDK
jgi:putative effector of murein hydrolase